MPDYATTENEALKMILSERRKELVFRGTRWMDLRRLNREPEHASVVRRQLDGKEYLLLPGDLRYTFLLREEEISLGLEHTC